MGGARGDHLALFGRADSRGHVRCSSFLTNKIIMVDYSKWDKLDYGDDDDSDGDEDLLCGNTAGNIAIFTNLDGTGTKWCAASPWRIDCMGGRRVAFPV